MDAAFVRMLAKVRNDACPEGRERLVIRLPPMVTFALFEHRLACTFDVKKDLRTGTCPLGNYPNFYQMRRKTPPFTDIRR